MYRAPDQPRSEDGCTEMCSSESKRMEPGMQDVSYRDGSCGRKTRATSTGSCVGRSSDRANGPVWSRKGAGFGSKGKTYQITTNQETRKIGGHCRYNAGYKLLRWLMWSLRREPRVLDRVRVEVGPSEQAGVVPEGGRLWERGTTYWPRRSGRLGKSVGTAINILASWHPGEQKGGGSFHVQRGYEW